MHSLAAVRDFLRGHRIVSFALPTEADGLSLRFRLYTGRQDR
jgi:hypothetical protein